MGMSKEYQAAMTSSCYLDSYNHSLTNQYLNQDTAVKNKQGQFYEIILLKNFTCLFNKLLKQLIS